MRALVRALQRRLRITTVFVTHDQVEAAALADRIALLLDGRLEQLGAPRDFYTAPRTARAARFFGWQVITEGATALAFRPESARVIIGDGHFPGTDLAGTIATVIDLGTRQRYTVALRSGENVEVEQEATNGPALSIGAQVRVQVPGEAVRFFAEA
jgi:ABC-type Fe3+/spermidine/putrescine transport system ATPase subunit